MRNICRGKTPVFRRLRAQQWASRSRALMLTVLLAAAASGQSPITYQYFYDGAGQLIRAVDSTGVSVSYTYDAAGNIVAITNSTISSGLNILSFSPAQAGPGTNRHHSRTRLQRHCRQRYREIQWSYRHGSSPLPQQALPSQFPIPPALERSRSQWVPQPRHPLLASPSWQPRSSVP